MRRKHVILPGKELFFACERLLLFRYPKPRIQANQHKGQDQDRGQEEPERIATDH